MTTADESTRDPCAAGEDDDPARMLEGGVSAGNVETGASV